MKNKNYFRAFLVVPMLLITGPVWSAGWTVSVDKNPMDDSTTAVARLEATDNVSVWTGSVRPVLLVRCKSHKTEVYMDADTNFDVEYGNSGSSHLVIRFDSQKAYKVNATQSTDGKAVFIPKPVGFAKKLLTSKQVLIGFTPFNAPPVIAQFDLEPNKEASLAEVKKTCKW